MIISFAHTTEALLKGKKTVTRREWKHEHAAKFKKDQFVDAWNYSPRVVKNNPRKVALIKLTRTPYLEKLCDMPESDVSLEGGLWKDKKDFIETAFDGDDQKEVWVVRFELMETVVETS